MQDTAFQYVVVIDREDVLLSSQRRGHVVPNSERFFFRNFTTAESAISAIGSLEKGLKVYKIFYINFEGNHIEVTVGFDKGRLTLICKEN